MTNARNAGTLVGRLAKDPVRLENRDGSSKVLLTVYVDRNFKTNGKYESDAIPVEAFIRKETDFEKTPFGVAKKGDLVSVATSVRMDVFQRDGKTVYELKVIAESFDAYLESRQVREARHGGAATTADQTETPVEVPAQAEAALVGAGAGDDLPY